MEVKQYTRPSNILFLVLPFGISSGFISVTLPYLLTHRGISVATTAGIVAIGVSANIWRFIWGPVADLTLSLRKWYWLGLLACIATLIMLSLMKYSPAETALITAIVFLSQVAATFVLLPVSAIMAHRIEPAKKGRASGWYQAGNLGGAGLGGGAGLWLATHFSVAVAGVALGVGCLLSGLVIQQIKDVKPLKDHSILTALRGLGLDLIRMIRIPVVLFVMIMLLLPIGTGAASNLWSAIAGDWKTSADTVALITGILSGLVSATGSITGGYIADRWGNWVAYLGSGSFCAVVTLSMAALPYQPYVYISGVMAYAFGLGLLNAAFSSVILYAIGGKNAATKYSLISSLGNIPVVYMTAVDGWSHDLFNSRFMLAAEALLGFFFVFLCLLVLRKLKQRKLLPSSIV